MASAARLASNRLLRQWCVGLPGDVLSIGSGTDQDGQGRRYRDYFAAAQSYTTSEPNDTDGACDCALDVRAMSDVPDARYDVLFCSGVLEHVDDLHAALAEIWRVLKPGGTLLVGMPFRQAIHRAPQDFWRFTEYGVRQLLRAYAQVEVIGVDDPVQEQAFPAAYWARATKPC